MAGSLCAKICVGDLTEEVIVQRPDRTPDGCGGFANNDWVDVAVIFCKFKQSAGREQFKHQRIEQITPAKFITTYRDDILATYRLSYAGRFYNIRYVNNLEGANMFLEIGADAGAMD